MVALLALLLLPILLFSIAGILLAVLRIEPTDTAVIVSCEWLCALAVMGIAGLLLRQHNLPPTAFGLTGVRADRVLLWAGAGVGASYAVLFAWMIAFGLAMLFFPPLQSLIEPEMEKRQEFFEQIPMQSFGISIFLLVAVAIYEETVFRGLLLPLLRRATGRWWLAILISAAVFGCLHIAQGPMAILPLMGVGAALSIIFVLSRSLLAVMIAHFMFDLLQFQLINALPELTELGEGMTP
ncbi:MAG: CPBP family intramembrane metalloprotease [Phycisphaerae bacterium]|nr:CPBP family intramembrane metalloprotease [Phycisphaerae bacterium]